MQLRWPWRRGVQSRGETRWRRWYLPVIALLVLWAMVATLENVAMRATINHLIEVYSASSTSAAGESKTNNEQPAAAPVNQEPANATTGGGNETNTAAGGTTAEQSTPQEAAPAEQRPVLASMTRPCSGSITGQFGWAFSRTHQDWRYHPGVDITVPSGTTVLAAFAGTVEYAKVTPESGFAVIIDHGGGVRTVYSELGSVLVREGAQVAAGDPVGVVGDPGVDEAADGPHLHFELWVDGLVKDPAPYLGQ